MTTYYVDSAAGSNTAPYDTWAKAATALGTISAIDAAGDTIYIANSHAENSAGAVNLVWAGTLASPTTLVCADKTSGAPPATASTASTVTTTGEFAIAASFSGGALSLYWYGTSFIAGVTGTTATPVISFATTSSNVLFENCNFELRSTGGAEITITGSTGQTTTLKNCTFKFSAASHTIKMSGAGWGIISGGALSSGGTSPTTMFTTAANSNLTVEGFDLSNADAAINLVSVGSAGAKVKIRNCKLPASWSGVLTASTLTGVSRLELNNTDSTNTNYRIIAMDAYGTLTNETTLIRTGGANDGVTGLSWKIVTTADTEWFRPFSSVEIAEWNAVAGSSVTATIEILHDSATNLKDDEVWLEVTYLSASGTPLGTLVNDSKANILATGAAQTASSETWTTSGMSNPNKQKLSVTFTPQMKGFVHAVVKVAKASYTLYVDPMLTIA